MRFEIAIHAQRGRMRTDLSQHPTLDEKSQVVVNRGQRNGWTAAPDRGVNVFWGIVSVGSDDGLIDHLTLMRDRQTVLRGQLTELFMGETHDYRMRMIIKRSRALSTEIFPVTVEDGGRLQDQTCRNLNLRVRIGIGEGSFASKRFMPDIARLLQASLAPVILVSATSLLILSINVRMMGIVSRLRQYVHAKHDAARNDRLQEAEAYNEQIRAIEQRAEMIRRCFLLVLTSLAGTITSCLLLGFGLYWPQAAVSAAVFFVLALICLLAGTFYYIREITVALSSVYDEARDSRFMDLGGSPESHVHHPL